MSTGLHPALERADALHELGRYDEAKALLGQRLAEDPEDVRALVRLARCLLRTEEADRALEVAGQALALAPEDIPALLEHARALQALGRLVDAEGDLREIIRLDPGYWYGYALLGHWLYRIRALRFGRENGGEVTREAMDSFVRESDELAREAVRLAPEEVFPYEVRSTIASLTGDRALAAEMDQAILRIDPNHPQALARRTRQAAAAPGVKAAEAATLYADALAAAPDSAPMRQGLDDASYRLLRGVRWLALLCVGLAGAMLDLFATEGATQRALPVPVGQRLWALVPFAALWAVGALLRYRRLRKGVRYNLSSLVRRRRWPRIVLGQAAWAMLCALLLTQVPWTDRTPARIVFWAGLVPTAATVWFDRRKKS
ncbi:tetratricopeptide repeat protein [Streptomyces naphthomycinicus]|uniref:tetratricopeptide repeat protein n=1 Tax=Streptomyces naphthomycinicus TaxID=2872625 RepID=UPI001CECE3C5|nr:tetratricopeptide repeat protein [Streptomyces sp. TML10]